MTSKNLENQFKLKKEISALRKSGNHLTAENKVLKNEREFQQLDTKPLNKALKKKLTEQLMTQ